LLCCFLAYCSTFTTSACDLESSTILSSKESVR
jgi:hypothetical protein